jgi:hypothetical protein
MGHMGQWSSSQGDEPMRYIQLSHAVASELVEDGRRSMARTRLWFMMPCNRELT